MMNVIIKKRSRFLQDFRFFRVSGDAIIEINAH